MTAGMRKNLVTLCLCFLTVVHVVEFFANRTHYLLSQSAALIVFIILICYAYYGFGRILYSDKTFSRSDLIRMFLLLLLPIVNVLFIFARAYVSYGLIDHDKITHEPAAALYFSIITWTTVGYGDVVPTDEARWVAAVEAIFGQLVTVTAIAFAAAIFRHLLSLRQDRVPKKTIQ